MNAWRAALAVVALGSCSLLAATRYHGATALNPRLEIRRGSRTLPDGRLQGGQPIDAQQAAERVPALYGLDEALSLVPVALTPARLLVDVELEGPGPRVELDRGGGSLLIRQGAERLPTSVWLHELGHARMLGARPTAPLAARVLHAIDEGAADYFAACLGRDPRVGDASELRDLRQPPRVDASEWATLALPLLFDAHRMGWALAARLYEAEPEPGPLLGALAACLDGPSELATCADTPAAAVRALLKACHAGRERERISSVLAAWLPAELSAQESLP